MSTRIIAIALALGIPPTASAQQEEPPQAYEDGAVPEEIIITGERSLHQLRTRMWEAEQNAYEIFNRFNDDDRFTISCREHEPTGSRIKRQVCAAAFEEEAMAAHGEDYWRNLRDSLDPNLAPTDNLSPPSSQPAAAVISKQLPEYRRKMRQVAEEHPQFLEAIREYSELRNRYEAATGRE